MKIYIFTILIFFPALCFAKCGMEKYTLRGVVSAPSGAPVEKTKVKIEWQDFNGKQTELGFSNKNGSYVIHLNFNKYSGAGEPPQPEDICLGSLQEIKVTYSSAEFGARTKILKPLKNEITENVQF